MSSTSYCNNIPFLLLYSLPYFFLNLFHYSLQAHIFTYNGSTHKPDLICTWSQKLKHKLECRKRTRQQRVYYSCLTSKYNLPVVTERVYVISRQWKIFGSPNRAWRLTGSIVRLSSRSLDSFSSPSHKERIRNFFLGVHQRRLVTTFWTFI